MRVLACLLFLTATAAADPQKPTATPAPATATTACKKVVVVGRGLDRKVYCDIDTPIVVKGKAPKPAVVVAPKDGRAVVGRPKSEDRLKGLSPFSK
jgi:hypothetical protein